MDTLKAAEGRELDDGPCCGLIPLPGIGEAALKRSSCSPAPVIGQLGRDMARVFGIPESYNVPGPGGVFLGSVGDQAHSMRRSSHNCAGAPGGQESGDYAPQFAHAWDARPVNRAHGLTMAAALLRDDRVRYVIYDGTGYYPDGSTFSLYHPTFHVSMKPGTHNDIRPFFGQEELFTVGQFEDLTTQLGNIEDRLTLVVQRQSLLGRIEAAKDAGNTALVTKLKRQLDSLGN